MNINNNQCIYVQVYGQQKKEKVEISRCFASEINEDDRSFVTIVPNCLYFNHQHHFWIKFIPLNTTDVRVKQKELREYWYMLE